MEKAQARLEEGPPIYVESLMDANEFRARCYVYESSWRKVARSIYEFSFGLMRWRWNMGKGLTEEEIAKFNTEIDGLLRRIKTE